MSYKKLLVGTDGSATSLKAVTVAAQMAGSDAQLIICCAHSDQAKTEEVLARGKEAATTAGASQIQTIAASGDPSEMLIELAEKEGADLLLVGNKGMTGVRRFMLGSVPNKISHHAPCDLMIVKTS